MLRQSSSRNYRSKKLRPRHSLQALLLFAVGIWIVYQLTRSYGKRWAVVVETDDGDAMDGGGEAARRRLGRKGFVGFAGRASDDGIVVGVGSDDDVGRQGAGWGAASSDDPLSKTEEGGDGDEEDLAADEDDGADEADDAIAGDEEDDDTDLLSQNGNSEDELKTVLGESDGATVFGNGDDDGTHLREPKATGSVQDAAASQQTSATAHRSASAKPLRDSSLKNASSVNLPLHDGGTANDAAKKSVVNGFIDIAAGAENAKHNVSVEDNRVMKQNETADNVHGISS